jgi:hypothetical protein
VLAAATPATYSYCVLAGSDAVQAELRDAVAATLAAGGGWGLGGQLVFSRVDMGCDVTLSIRGSAGMSELDPACTKQTTCERDAQVGIAQASWQSAPLGWQGSIMAYRSELINHEVGHWLGFDHAGCDTTSQSQPLVAPDVVLDGCSPNWYALPAIRRPE